jgi:hypothetical protein
MRVLYDREQLSVLLSISLFPLSFINNIELLLLGVYYIYF